MHRLGLHSVTVKFSAVQRETRSHTHEQAHTTHRQTHTHLHVYPRIRLPVYIHRIYVYAFFVYSNHARQNGRVAITISQLVYAHSGLVLARDETS